MEHRASTWFFKLCFCLACFVMQHLQLSSKHNHYKILCKNCAILVLMYIISEMDCTWLFPEDKPCLRMWSVPQDRGQCTYYQIRLARETCWMSIIVHCWGFHHCNPSSSAATLRGRWRETAIHCTCHCRGHKEGSWWNQWPEPTTPLPYPSLKKNKR